MKCNETSDYFSSGLKKSFSKIFICFELVCIQSCKKYFNHRLLHFAFLVKRDNLPKKSEMEKKHFNLGAGENSKIVKIIQIIFGTVCLVVAIFWLAFNAKLLGSDKTLWITILFLTGFGLYEIWAGLGKAARFIEFSGDKIRLKKNMFFSPTDFYAKDLLKIDLLPFTVIFYPVSGKKTVLRLGATYQETNETIKDELIIFSEEHSIKAEFIEEKL